MNRIKKERRYQSKKPFVLYLLIPFFMGVEEQKKNSFFMEAGKKEMQYSFWSIKSQILSVLFIVFGVIFIQLLPRYLNQRFKNNNNTCFNVCYRM